MVRPIQIALRPLSGLHSRFPLEPEGAAPNLPNLWRHAGAMHERILQRITDPDALCGAARMPYNERRGLLAWIEPVEAFVRALLIASAITFLLMTVKGRRLLKETRKMAPPGRAPLQHGQERIVMPHPGWHTIANAPRPAPKPEAAAEPERAPIALDPKTWTCPFHVIRWLVPEGAGASRKPMPAAFDALLESIRGPQPQKRAPPTPVHSGRHPPRHSGNPCAVNLARRLEAVGRVLANPDRHIMRVARYLARLPIGVLDQDFALPPGRHVWQQGREAFTGLVRLLCRAINAFNLCQSPEPRPG